MPRRVRRRLAGGRAIATAQRSASGPQSTEIERATLSCENTTFLWFTGKPRRLRKPASCRQQAALDPHRPDHYRSVRSPDRRNRRRAARGTDRLLTNRLLTIRASTMAWRCELTGKRRQIGHRVSHSNRKTKRRFLPNLLNVTLISDALGRSIRLRVSANALKSVDHRGGLDAFLLAAKDADLSPRVLELKRQVAKKRQAAA